MHISRRLALIAACAGVSSLAPLAAVAETPTTTSPPAPALAAPPAAAAPAAPPATGAAQTGAAQTGAAEDAIRAANPNLFGLIFPFPGKITAITPEGDHYRLTFVPDDLGPIGLSGTASATLAAHPLDHGQWALENITLAQPIALKLALPARKGGPGGTADLTETIATQAAHAVIAPGSGLAPSRSLRATGLDFAFATPRRKITVHVGQLDQQTSELPAAGGRLDETAELGAQDISVAPDGATGGPSAFTARRIALAGHMEGWDRARGMAALQVALNAEKTALARRAARPPHPAPGTPKPPAPLDRADLRALYLAWRGVATGGSVSETLDGGRFIIRGHTVSVGHAALGGGVATPDGTLSAQLSLALDAVTSPDIPPWAQDYVPSHLVIQPSLSAINLADLDALVMALTAPGDQHQDIAALIAAMFAHGSIVAGIDTLELDVGPAHLVGTGKLTALRPDMLRGQAEISMTGFDALADRINAEPLFASALPVITMIRGLGRQQGERMVWRISSENDDVTVNGTDLTALLRAARKEAGPRSAAPPPPPPLRKQGP